MCLHREQVFKKPASSLLQQPRNCDPFKLIRKIHHPHFFLHFHFILLSLHCTVFSHFFATKLFPVSRDGLTFSAKSHPAEEKNIYFFLCRIVFTQKTNLISRSPFNDDSTRTECCLILPPPIVFFFRRATNRRKTAGGLDQREGEKFPTRNS